jgi:hypothetical protein
VRGVQGAHRRSGRPIAFVLATRVVPSRVCGALPAAIADSIPVTATVAVTATTTASATSATATTGGGEGRMTEMGDRQQRRAHGYRGRDQRNRRRARGKTHGILQSKGLRRTIIWIVTGD